MDSASMILKAKDFIEARLLQTKKKFEIIYSATKDNGKKGSIEDTMSVIDRDIKKLRADMFTEADLKRYKIEMEDIQTYIETSSYEKKGDFKILRNIPIVKLNKYSRNEEINSIWSYLQFFGREYLGLLSEQNLKLDYGHAYQRDRFFNTFNENIRILENYGEILEQLETSSSSGGKDYKDRLLGLQNKQYRDVIIRTGRFLHSIITFIQDILDSEKNGEKVMTEPDRVIEIKGESSSIDGITTRQALMDLYVFIQEFIDFLKIPDLKKINEEEEE